jgi:hypothetical protein
MADTITTEDKLACAEREVKMRERVYPRWVELKKMSLGKATHEIEAMKAIVADYQKLLAKELVV